jgi:hypothetical protein
VAVHRVYGQDTGVFASKNFCPLVRGLSYPETAFRVRKMIFLKASLWCKLLPSMDFFDLPGFLRDVMVGLSISGIGKSSSLNCLQL